MTFQQIVRRHAAAIFLFRGREKIDFATFARQVAACHRQLRSRIQPGDIVLVGDMPAEDFAVWLFALWSCDAIAFPLNHQLTETGIKTLLTEINPVALITADKIPLPIQHINAALPAPIDDTERVDFSWESDAPSTIIMTSGSTGKPKYAVLSRRNHYYSAKGVCEYFQLTTADRWLLDLPLFHVGGLAILIRCFLNGTQIQLKEHDLENALIERPPSLISLVSAQYSRLIEQPDCLAALSSCRAVFLGGSSIPAQNIQHAHDNNIKLFTSYGLTEMASTVYIRDEQTHVVKRLRYREVKIENGAILLKGPCLFKGYLQAAKIQPALDELGWFHSRDMAEITSDGLNVTGRMDNMFISGGENIHPEEIERALRTCPGINNALVFPVDDSRYGQRPAAFIQIETAREINIDKLRKKLITVLPKFKIPVRFFTWVPHLNSTVSKISRPMLPGLSRDAKQLF